MWLCAQLWQAIVLANVFVKVKHMRALLFDLQCCQDQETQTNGTCVWVDNTAAIAVATGNDFTHETVKHLTVKVRFLQEYVQLKIILLVYIKTGKNISDIMTKQSPGPQFIQHRNYTLGMIDVITDATSNVAVIWRRIRVTV